MLSRDPCARRIVEFVQQEVEHNKDYSSTKFRHLLRMIAISIQSGYWHSMEDLLGLVDKLRLLH